MSDRLSEIRARAEAATPGPWVAEREDDYEWTVVGSTYEPDCRYVIADCGFDSPQSNATFIAHARADIPYLLAEVERLRAALGRIGIHATGCGMQFGHPCEFGCITVNFWIYATSALTEGGES